MCMFCVQDTKENLLRRRVIKKLEDKIKEKFPKNMSKVSAIHTTVSAIHTTLNVDSCDADINNLVYSCYYSRPIKDFDQKLDQMQQIEDRIIEDLTQLFKE